MPRVFLVKKKWPASSSGEQEQTLSSNGNNHSDRFPQSETDVMEVQVESIYKGNSLSRQPIPAFHVDNENSTPRYTTFKVEPISPANDHPVRETLPLYLKHNTSSNERYFLPHALPHVSTHFPIFAGSRDRQLIDPYFYPRPRDSFYTRTLSGYQTVSKEFPYINGCHNGYLRNDAGRLCLHQSAFKPTSANISGSLELLYNWAFKSDNSRLREELMVRNETLKQEQRLRDIKEIKLQDEKRRHRERPVETKIISRSRNAEDTDTQWEKIKFLNDTMADISKYFNFEKEKSNNSNKRCSTEQMSSEHSQNSVEMIRERKKYAEEENRPEFNSHNPNLRNQNEEIPTTNINCDFDFKKIKTEVVSEDEEQDCNIQSPLNSYNGKNVSTNAGVKEEFVLNGNSDGNGIFTNIAKQESCGTVFCAETEQEKTLQVKSEEKECITEDHDEKKREEVNIKSEVKPNPQLKYKCDECGKAFSRSTTLVTHQRIHSGDKPFICGECGRAFRQPGNLTRHRLTHTSLKPHVCTQCGKAFNRASNLQTHMRTHSNDKPFHCDFCGKGFNQKIDMKIHRYIHTGEKPHRCQKCGRGFKQLTHLTYHMRTHSDVRMYHCQYCGKGFNQKGNLQAHIYGHTGERPFKCDVCGKGFTLTSTLNTHKRIHAPKKPFQCKFCDKAFYQKNALKTHYISSHPCIEGESIL